jgi:hypothetical protein
MTNSQSKEKKPEQDVVVKASEVKKLKLAKIIRFISLNIVSVFELAFGVCLSLGFIVVSPVTIGILTGVGSVGLFIASFSNNIAEIATRIQEDRFSISIKEMQELITKAESFTDKLSPRPYQEYLDEQARLTRDINFNPDHFPYASEQSRRMSTESESMCKKAGLKDVKCYVDPTGRLIWFEKNSYQTPRDDIEELIE